MVINGGARSKPGELAHHLLRADTNERVTVREIEGVSATDLRGALLEMGAMGAGSRSGRRLYHANIDWRHDETMTDAQKAQAVADLGRELGLEHQPRAVVEHVKEGREHLHVVWLRIDTDTMKAIPDSHNFRKHEAVARELERQFGHERVQGAHIEREGVERPERRPSDPEMMQAARSGLTPAEAKAELSEIWRSTDTGRAFVAAVEDAGWMLARGDKRDFVVIDRHGETHSLSRRIEGAKAAEVRQRMADIDPATVPTVDQAREAVRDRQAVREPGPVRENVLQDPAPVFCAQNPEQDPSKPTPGRSHQFTEIDELALMALRRQEAFARQDRVQADEAEEVTPQHRQAKPQPVPEPQTFRRQDPDPRTKLDPSANDGRKAMEDLARTDPLGMASRHGFHRGDQLKAPEDMRREMAERLRGLEVVPTPEPVREAPQQRNQAKAKADPATRAAEAPQKAREAVAERPATPFLWQALSAARDRLAGLAGRLEAAFTVIRERTRIRERDVLQASPRIEGEPGPMPQATRESTGNTVARDDTSSRKVNRGFAADLLETARAELARQEAGDRAQVRENDRVQRETNQREAERVRELLRQDRQARRPHQPS